MPDHGAGVKRKRRLGCGEEDALYYYDVNPTHPEVRAEQLFVWSARAAAPEDSARARSAARTPAAPRAAPGLIRAACCECCC